jgi:hypothetical protein
MRIESTSVPAETNHLAHPAAAPKERRVPHASKRSEEAVLAEPPEASTARRAQRGGPAPEGAARASNPPRAKPEHSTLRVDSLPRRHHFQWCRADARVHPLRRRSAAKPEQLADAFANRIVWHHFE